MKKYTFLFVFYFFIKQLTNNTFTIDKYLQTYFNRLQMLIRRLLF